MEDTTPSGYTVVDSPLPYAVNGELVDERYLTEQIDELWVARQTYHGAIQRQKSEMRSLDSTLAEISFNFRRTKGELGMGFKDFVGPL
jgi:hypothetical protein